MRLISLLVALGLLWQQGHCILISTIDTNLVETSLSCAIAYDGESFSAVQRLIFGQAFTVEKPGWLSTITVYPQFVHCNDTDTQLNLTIYVFEGNVWEYYEEEDSSVLSDLTLESLLQAAANSSNSTNDLRLLGAIGQKSDASEDIDSGEAGYGYTCADYADELEDANFPGYTYSFVNDEVSLLSDIELDNTTVYTWIVEYNGQDPSVEYGFGEPCIGETDDLDNFESWYAYTTHDSNTDAQTIQPMTDEGWSVDIAVEVKKMNCSAGFPRKNYKKKDRISIWYYDEALAIISQYVDSSEYSIFQTVMTVLDELVNLNSDEKGVKWKYKYSQKEVQEMYDAILYRSCVMDVEVWHMFGLCLARDNHRNDPCDNWSKEDRNKRTDWKKSKDKYNLTTYYQIDAYLRFDTKEYPEKYYKIMHDILIKEESWVLELINQNMHDLDRDAFIAFEMYTYPLSSWSFDVPFYASLAVYCFLGLAVLFAIAGAVHGFVYWGADNVRISGIILFGLYTWDFYSDIVFNLNLINYSPRLDYLFWLSLVFIVVPWIANMVSLSRYQNKWCKDETVRERVYQWFVAWQRVLYALAALSGSAFGTVELANSYVFGYDFFCMGLNERHLKKFNNNRLWSGIVAENLPQLCIQFWFLFETDIKEPDPVALLAITSSSLSIGAALLDIYSSKKLFAVLKDKQSGQYVDKSSLSLLVVSQEIHENKARLQITTYAFRDMLAEILTTHPRSVEMHFPVATSNGFKMKFTVFSKKLDADAIKSILQQSIDSNDIQQKIRQCWRLNTKPEVKKLIIETDVMIGADDDDEVNLNTDNAGENQIQMTSAIGLSHDN